jgi:2-amino-4-hydroxy-6-hydroxymethyldihydropteridine diphosphokinase
MIYIALGGNRAFRQRSVRENLSAALGCLEASGCRVKAVSRLYRTPAWPDPSDPSFLNACAALEWPGGPASLMTLMHAVEDQFGRRRGRRNAPRTLDLDLLDFHGASREAAPQLPHPRLESRAFVLLPLRDIAPHWRHPVTGVDLDRLIARLPLVDRRDARVAAGREILRRPPPCALQRRA